MNRMSASLAAIAAAASLGASVANAADLYTPAPAPMPAYTGGWYFSGFGGANWLDDTSFGSGGGFGGPVTVGNSYDAGYLVGGAIGYDFGPAMGPLGLRLEAEVSYRNNDVDVHSINSSTFSDSVGETSALAGMGNIFFDLNTGSPFTIYGGGGLGVANVEFDGHGTNPSSIAMNDDDTVFAWQAIAGVGFEVAPSWIIDVQYRYFNASDVSLTDTSGGVSSSTDYESHAVLAGIRVKF